MKNSIKGGRLFGTRPRAAALYLFALIAALLVTALLFRPAESRQAPPDLAADALPRLNLLGRHRTEAADYATQIKARYPPTSAEYVEAKRRCEEADEKFAALIDTLALSVKENSGGRRVAALREQSRLAAEAADSFADWVDGLLQLLSRARRTEGAPPKGAEAAEAASAFAGAFGQREERAKGRAVELMNELVRFKPWDEIPPVRATADEEPSTSSTTPTPAPSSTPPPTGR